MKDFDELVDALNAREGVTCVVGAGGKKTTIYRLARTLDRAAVTATVRIPIFDEEVEAVHVTEDPVGALREAGAWPVGIVPEREREDRYRGYDPAAVDRIADAGVADAVLVKADGARSRLLKAPKEGEPQLPDAADIVVPVASVRAASKPLSEAHVHRPERVAALTGLSEGDAIEPEHVAAVLADGDGGLKGVPPDATVIPVVNMADTPELADLGREVAEGILDRTADRPVGVPRVVVARMVADDPVVAVVSR